MKDSELNNPLFEPLNAEYILANISPNILCFLAKLEIFDTVSSTNQLLLERGKSCLSGTFCFAEYQTAGRGRRGRQWETPYGAGITCSVRWCFRDEQSISGLSIAVGVIIANVLNAYGLGTQLQLKWPNDILYAGRKLAGILIEKTGESVVIGIGINLNLPTPILKDRIDVSEIIRKPVERNRLAGLLVEGLLRYLPVFQQSQLKAFRLDWQKYDYLVNHPVTLLLPNKTIQGLVKGINDRGELVLLDEHNHWQVFSYGEVSVIRE